MFEISVDIDKFRIVWIKVDIKITVFISFEMVIVLHEKIDQLYIIVCKYSEKWFFTI